MKWLRQSIDQSLKTTHLVENIKKGSFVYLILPFYVWTTASSSLALKLFSLVFGLLIFMRTLWLRYFNRGRGTLFLSGLYFFSISLALSITILACMSVWFNHDHSSILFITMLVATFTWGIMVSFSIEPLMSLALGALILLPFSMVLASLTNSFDWWVLMASILFLGWNMYHVIRTFRNTVMLIESQENLVFQQTRLRQFLDTLPGYVFWFDHNLRYIEANSRYLDALGMEREKLMGTTLGSRNPDDPLVQRVRQFKNSLNPHEIMELSSLGPGVECPLLVTMLRHKAGNSEEQISVLGLDVSSLKERELEIESRRQQLLAQEKFVALGEIAGGIAHEINNPLVIICGKTDLLLKHKERGTLTDEILDGHLRGINSTALRIARIINSLKVLLRSSKIAKLEDTTVGEVLEPIWDLIYARVEGMGVALEVDKKNFSLPIRCGFVELGQALLNLIVNSAQAVESLEQRWIKVEINSDENKVYLTVTDSGGGIPPELRKKLFQPFFTTKEPGVGTGIGLSLSKELMQKQNGDLYYKDGLPNTTFVIEIPRSEPSNKKTPLVA